MTYDHLDRTLPADVRTDLLARDMTTVEKCWQLTAALPWWLASGDGTEPRQLTELLVKASGHVCNFAADDPARLAQVVVTPLYPFSHGLRYATFAPSELLGYTNLARDFVAEPARVDVFLSLDADDRQLAGAFELIGASRVLASAERSFRSEGTVAEFSGPDRAFTDA